MMYISCQNIKFASSTGKSKIEKSDLIFTASYEINVTQSMKYSIYPGFQLALDSLILVLVI